MSKYGWERGTILIPTKEWKRVRDELVAVFNKHQAEQFDRLNKIYDLILAHKKTFKRGTFSVTTAWDQLSIGSAHRHLFEPLECNNGLPYGYSRLLMGTTDEGRPDPTKLVKPKKKDLPLAVATKHTEYAADDGSITINHAKRAITWNVPDNNHAVEFARRSVMGRALFRILSTVTWTRGSGGEIVGNDEYNRDSHSAGDGANYVTARYGAQPKVKPAKVSRYPR